MLFQTNFLFSFLVFFPLFSLFVLIFFLYSVLFFYVVKIPYFSILSIGHGKGLFIVPAMTSVLLFCPLTAFVWSGHACQSYKTPVRQRRIHFVYSVHRGLILSLRAAAFPAAMFISSLLTLRACTQRFPLKLPLLGGLSSQQDVPPKRGLSRGRK